MNISERDLKHEYARAIERWPFIAHFETTHKLPYMLLFAVGSRETNLTNEVGDGGHGHGVWQLDNRSHTIPDGFDGNVGAQCQKAATMLQELLHEFGGNVQEACAAYNAGAGTVHYNLANGLDIDSGTANGDYGRDVVDRMHALERAYPRTPEGHHPSPHPRPRTYTVRSGDTLSGIAAHYGMSWEKLYQANKHTVHNPNVIYICQVLVIPS